MVISIRKLETIDRHYQDCLPRVQGETRQAHTYLLFDHVTMTPLMLRKCALDSRDSIVVIEKTCGRLTLYDLAC